MQMLYGGSPCADGVANESTGSPNSVRVVTLQCSNQHSDLSDPKARTSGRDNQPQKGNTVLVEPEVSARGHTARLYQPGRDVGAYLMHRRPRTLCCL